MTNISDLLDMNELAQMMADKRINKQVHPTLPISIYNYSNRAQYLNQWTKAERVCRGLIVEDATGKVIARGPEKFMNFGQGDAVPLDTKVLLTKKFDGSLGIGWTYGGEVGVATRGSFTSDQSKFATKNMTEEVRSVILDTQRIFGDGIWTTPIYEIIYPENRIVLDYGDLEGSIYLGDVNSDDGVILWRPDSMYVGPVMSLAEALTVPIPDDEEGYVLDILEDVLPPRGVYIPVGHLKLKGDRYKQLHALLTNTTGRRIWVQLAARACHSYIKDPMHWGSYVGGDPEDFLRVDQNENLLDSLLTNVPDEFYDWVTKQIDSIEDSVSDLVTQAMALAVQAADIQVPFERYEFLKFHPLAGQIIYYLKTGDDSMIILKAWNISQPSGDETPFKAIED